MALKPETLKSRLEETRKKTSGGLKGMKNGVRTRAQKPENFWDRFAYGPEAERSPASGIFAPAKPQTPRNTRITSPSMEAAQSKARRGYQPPAQQEAPEQISPDIFGKSLSDYLSQAQSMTAGGAESQLAALAAQRGQMQQSADSGDQKLAAMYAALQQAAQQQSAETGQRYEGARQQSQELTAQAQQALQGANQGVQSAQSEMFANLGIAPTQDTAETQAEYAKIGNSGVQATGNAYAQHLLSQGNSQQDYSNAMGTAAGFAGAGRRSDLQQGLMKALQEISGAEAQLKDSQSQQSLATAQSMYDNDLQQWRWQQEFGAGRDDEAYNRAFQEQQAAGKAQTQAAPSYRDMVPYERSVTALQGSGLPPASQRKIAALINQGFASQGTDVKGNKVSYFQAAYGALEEAMRLNQISSQEFNQGVAALGYGYTE